MADGMIYECKETKVCMNCHHMREYDITIKLNDYGISTDCILSAEVWDSDTGNEISMRCENCNSEDTVLIDPKIAHVINILNYKGYKREFSCQGHRDSYSVTLPYITFTKDVPVTILSTLPEGWHVIDINDCEEDLSIYFNNGGDKNIDEVDIDFNEKELLIWALSLPFLDGEKYVKDRNEIKKRFLAKYFAEEKYWYYRKGHNIKTHHSKRNSEEPCDKCDNCDWTNCDGCEDLKLPPEFEFSCDASELAKGISLVYGIRYEDAYNLVINNDNEQAKMLGIFKPDDLLLQLYCPDFLDKISSLTHKNMSIFDDIYNSGGNPYSLVQDAREKYDYMSDEYKHIHNQYELWKEYRFYSRFPEVYDR